jgi:multiple sugar transport system substrate-binding protein
MRSNDRFRLRPFFWILIALSLLLAGCLGGPQASPPPGEAAPVTITFAAGAHLQAVYQPLIEAFHENHPDIRVVFVPYQDGYTFDRDGMEAVAAYADTTVLPGRDRVIAGAPYLLDLTPFVETEPAFQPDDFWSGALTGCQTADGRQVGIPVDLEPAVLLFDPQAFDDAGLAYPAPGWYWEDFRSAVDGLSHPPRYAFADASYAPDWLLTSGALLLPVIDEAIGRSDGRIDTGTLEPALAWYFEALEKGHLYPTHEAGAGEAQDWGALFASGQPPLWIGGANSWIAQGPAIETAGVAPFPIREDNDRTTPVIPNCGVISAGSAHPRAAWQWLDFLSRQWIPAGDPARVPAVPPRQSVAEANAYWDSIPQAVRPAYQYAVRHGWYGSAHPEALERAMGILLEVADGEHDLRAALDQIAAMPVEAVESGRAAESVAVARPPAADPANRTTIRYFTYAVLQSAAQYQALSDEFARAHPDIRIQLPSTSSPNDFPDSPDDQLAFFSEQYDCFEARPPNPAAVQRLLDLDPLFEGDSLFLRDDFYPGQLEAFTRDGALYAIPVSVQPNRMFYNADLLQARGLEPPDNDWTFDDFIALAAAASGELDGVHRYGFLPYGSSDLTWLLAGRNVRWVEERAGLLTVDVNQPEAAAAFEWLQEMASAGVFAPVTPASENAGEAIVDWVSSGNVAFWTAMEEDVWYRNAAQGSGFAVGSAPLPHTAESSPLVVRLAGLYISANTAQPAACWEWLKFLAERPAAFEGFPVHKSVSASPAFEASAGAARAATYRAIAERGYAWTIPSGDPLWNEVLHRMNQAYDRILFDHAEPAAELRAAQRGMVAFFDCLRQAGYGQPGDEVADSDRIHACAVEAGP